MFRLRGRSEQRIDRVELLQRGRGEPGQDVEPAPDSDTTDGRWRIGSPGRPDRVISTVDPDTRQAYKSRERRQDGFKAHVVVEPDTGLITNARLTKASGPDNSDARIAIVLLESDPSRPVEPVEVLADSAKWHVGRGLRRSVRWAVVHATVSS